jgi:hypothetical protein
MKYISNRKKREFWDRWVKAVFPLWDKQSEWNTSKRSMWVADV